MSHPHVRGTAHGSGSARMTPAEPEEEYEEGRDAYLDGTPEGDSPYAQNTREGTDWNDGWWSAHDERPERFEDPT